MTSHPTRRTTPVTPPTRLSVTMVSLAIVLSSCGHMTRDTTARYDWTEVDRLNESLPEGVRILSLVDEKLPLRAWAAIVDRDSPGVEVLFATASDSSGRETSAEFARRLGACVVVNGGYFTMNEIPARHVGLLLIDDSLHAAPTDTLRRGATVFPVARASLGMLEDGSPDIAWTASRNGRLHQLERPYPHRPGEPASGQSVLEPWTVRHAIGAGPALLSRGTLDITSDEEVFFGTSIPATHPRTAAGYRKDGSLILLVVDGRQPASLGVNLTHLALLMLDLGAWEAINLDGGGSSTMVVNGTLVNRPAGRDVQRTVKSAIAVTCTPSSK